MQMIAKRIAELRYERQLVLRALRALERLSELKTGINEVGAPRPSTPLPGATRFRATEARKEQL